MPLTPEEKRKRVRERYAANKEKEREKSRRYYAANKEKEAKRHREKRGRNPELYSEIDRQSRIRNREKTLQQVLKWRAKNKDKVKAYTIRATKNYRKKHPDRVALTRSKARRKRALLRLGREVAEITEELKCPQQSPQPPRTTTNSPA